MIEFPAQIKWEDINRTHADYDPKLPELGGLGKLTVYNDLFTGGSEFRKRIEHYLDRRMLEDGGGEFNAKSAGLAMPDAKSTRDRRKKISRYTPVIKGKLGVLNSATLQSPPRITEMPADAKDSGSDDAASRLALAGETESGYWNKLNGNADGLGGNLYEIAQDLIRNAMIHGRAYLLIRFGKAQNVETLEQQKAIGALDATLHSVAPAVIDDWKIIDGATEYIRSHTMEEIRRNPWEEPIGTRHRWTYYTPDVITVYAADEIFGAERPQYAAMESATPHSLGVVPILPLRMPSDLWLMETLRDAILAHYNRRASITWSLNQMAFSILTLIGTDNEQNVEVKVDPEVEALVLKSGQASFISPAPGVWAALSDDEQRLEQAMDDAIQVAALSVASRDSSGRQSGVAKFRESGPLANLLSNYGMCLRNIFESAIEIIKKARSENGNIKLEGLDKFDIQSLELRTKQTKDVLPMSPSKTFDRWMTSELLMAHAKDAPATVRAKIAEEVMAAQIKKENDDAAAKNDDPGDPLEVDPLREKKGKTVQDSYKERTV